MSSETARELPVLVRPADRWLVAWRTQHTEPAPQLTRGSAMRDRRKAFLALAIAVVVSATGLLSWFFGARVWFYTASVALLLLIVYALRSVPRAYRRHGAGQIEQERIGRERVAKVRRNDPCPCGSGEKYKRCCGTG